MFPTIWELISLILSGISIVISIRLLCQTSKVMNNGNNNQNSSITGNSNQVNQRQ